MMGILLEQIFMQIMVKLGGPPSKQLNKKVLKNEQKRS